MASKLFTALALAAALAGCQKQGNDRAAAPPSKIEAPAPKPAATIQEWRAAVASTYVESKTESVGNGMTEFQACFDDVASAQCANFMWGKRDVLEDGEGVREIAAFIATEADLTAIGKIAASKELVVRLTGEKGITHVLKTAHKSLRLDVKNMQFVHAKLSKSLDGKLPATCS